MLNPNIASMPLAKQLSYIRNTISNGNLHGGIRERTGDIVVLTSSPVAKQRQEPLGAKHT